MALYKFEIDANVSNMNWGLNNGGNASSFVSAFNAKCQELGITTVNFNGSTSVLTINDKNFSLYQSCGVGFMFYICDSYNYEFFLSLQTGLTKYDTGGDNISQWPNVTEAPSDKDVSGSGSGAESYHYSSAAAQILCCLDKQNNPIVVGGFKSVESPTIVGAQPSISFFNGGGGLVNAFKDNEKIYLSKLFVSDTQNLDFYNIIEPKHLYISKNLVDAGQKTIVNSNGKKFINVGNIFYMENNPIILNKTTWISEEVTG